MIFLNTFFTITEANMASTTGYVKDLIGELSPVWILVVGLGVGLIVFEVVINAIRARH